MARYEQLCKRLDLQQISQQQQSSVTDTAQFHTYDQRQERVGEMVPGGDASLDMYIAKHEESMLQESEH